MLRVTIEADTEHDAIAKCIELYGWTPDAIREVDSGDENVGAWMCFDDAADALTWDAQR